MKRRPGLAYPWHDEHGSVVLYHQRVSIQENGIEVSKVMPWWVPSADPDDNVRDFDSNALVLVARSSGGMPEPYKGLIYRLGEVLAAVRSGDGPVWLGEGESDAETLRGLGYVATTGWGGAGKWSPAQAAWFEGYTGTVIVAVDNDPVGAKEGVLKFRSLTALGVDVRLAAPPDDFKDLSDWVEAGGNPEDIEKVEVLDLQLLSAQVSEPVQRSYLLAGLDADTHHHLEHLLDPPEVAAKNGDDADLALEDAIMVQRLERAERLRRLARRNVTSAETLADWQAPPSFTHMGEELHLEEKPLTWTVDHLHETGTNTLLVAGYKTGKTVLALNLAKALVDNEPFLDFKTSLPDDGRRVAWWNFELTEDQARRWVRELGVEHPERISHLPLRGYRMPLQTEQIVEWAVRWLQEHSVKVWLIDPFAEAYDGDENDNSAVRVWLQNLNEIKRRASVEDVVLVSHTGHADQDEGRERARGASNLEGWKDAGWYYTKHPDNDDLRFLRAFGRDVDVKNFAIKMNRATRALSRDDASANLSRDEAVTRNKAKKVAEIVTRQPGLNATALRSQLGKGTNSVKDGWIEAAEDIGLIRREIGGKGRSTQHYPVEQKKIPIKKKRRND